MRYLIEDGLFGADEGEFEHGAGAVGQDHRMADVEELALVVDVSVVAVDAVGARESVDDVGPDGRRVARQTQTLLHRHRTALFRLTHDLNTSMFKFDKSIQHVFDNHDNDIQNFIILIKTMTMSKFHIVLLTAITQYIHGGDWITLWNGVATATATRAKPATQMPIN